MSQPASDTDLSLTLRQATLADGAPMWAFVKDTQVLEPNTCYAYLLLTSHFADTAVVAEANGAMVGFVAAYRPPTRPNTVFVWQIGVSSAIRGRGLGKRLLHHLVSLPACHDVTHLEATVATSNEPSARLFQGFARSMNATCEQSQGFTPADFGTSAHEAEVLFKIGPLRRTL